MKCSWSHKKLEPVRKIWVNEWALFKFLKLWMPEDFLMFTCSADLLNWFFDIAFPSSVNAIWWLLKGEHYTPDIIPSEVDVSCVLVLAHASWLGPKQNKRNIYLRADDKRCRQSVYFVARCAMNFLDDSRKFIGYFHLQWQIYEWKRTRCTRVPTAGRAYIRDKHFLLGIEGNGKP